MKEDGRLSWAEAMASAADQVVASIHGGLDNISYEAVVFDDSALSIALDVVVVLRNFRVADEYS